MIRVNLLEGTAEHRVSVQKTKVAARRGQQLFMLASALLIFAIATGVDHLWTNNAHADAQAELDREQEEAKKLEGDIQRKNELEAELKQVEERIKVIKQLPPSTSACRPGRRTSASKPSRRKALTFKSSAPRSTSR
jgi:Tfp pilus assembly protein PilN